MVVAAPLMALSSPLTATALISDAIADGRRPPARRSFYGSASRAVTEDLVRAVRDEGRALAMVSARRPADGGVDYVGSGKRGVRRRWFDVPAGLAPRIDQAR